MQNRFLKLRNLVVASLALALGVTGAAPFVRTAMAMDAVELGTSSDDLEVFEDVQELRGSVSTANRSISSAKEATKLDSASVSGDGISLADDEPAANVWTGKDFMVAIREERSGTSTVPNGVWFDFPEGGKGYKRGDVPCTGWIQIGDAWYNFGQDARMLVGWNDVADDSGVVRKYYFRLSGAMATGWAEIDGNKYYFRPDGSMLTGWLTTKDEQKGEERHYFFAEDGRMLTDWQEIDGQRFYFRPTGSLAIGWATIDGTGKCYFDESGMLATGWKEMNGRRYYFNGDGVMQVGEVTIDGQSYEFNNKGVLVS